MHGIDQAHESITLHPLGAGRQLVCRVAATAPGETRPDDEATWARLCAANPRLHDGPILAVRAFDAVAATLDVAVDSFRRLVTRADGSVRLLGVKAVITGADAAGGEHALIGLRHTHTRTYGGMWELAPSGGVGPGAIASASPGCVREEDLLRHLSHEAHEELGIDLGSATDDPRATVLLEDRDARSVDVVFAMRWRGLINPHGQACRATDRDWEYVDTAWLARAGARAWVQAHARAVSPATVALLAWMRWL